MIFMMKKKLSDFYENHYNNLHLSKNKKLKNMLTVLNFRTVIFRL